MRQTLFYQKMKKLTTLLCSLSFIPVFAGEIRESQIPEAVKAYVLKNYPEASNIKWDFDKDDLIYEADFKIKTMEYELEITPSGKLHASKEDISVSVLPRKVTEYIQANYPDYIILGANKNREHTAVTFDVGIKGKNKQGHIRHYNLVFNEKGEFIRR